MNSTSHIDLDRIVSDLKKIANPICKREFVNTAPQILERISSVFGLTAVNAGEYSVLSGTRADALYNYAIIVYTGNSLEIKDTITQMITFITSKAKAKELSCFCGIIISNTITFVTFDTITGNWAVRGPYKFDKKAVLRVIMVLRGLTRKKLCAEELLKDIGPESDVGSTCIATLYDTLVNTNNRKTVNLFRKWVKTFLQMGYTRNNLQGLNTLYTGKDCEKLLFCIHTYYALLIKMIAAETASLYSARIKSYLAELEEKSFSGIKEFKESLKNVEEGTFFKDVLKITNFIEDDYFSWYLAEVDTHLMDTLVETAKRLSDYEYGTPVLQSEETTDILKTLYQELVPKPIRHNLGEYYTPDWLAQFLLDRVHFTVDFLEILAENDLTNPLQLRLLDPSCGSGTFLVEALKRLRLYAEDKCITDVLAEHVFENIVGIDCNPLAVLAAKTNYLLIIGDLIGHTCDTELPVYCADLIRERPALSKFDYVVGNPPWVLWDHLPVNYRRNTQELWKDYGLFTLPASQAHHGGGKKDISILFTYVCADRYLKDSGIFGFFITQSVFKTKGAGEGFRKFTLHDTNLKVVEVHDFVKVNPFEAHNRTAAIIFEKGRKTVYPAPYMVWRTLSDIDRKGSLKTVSKKLKLIEMAAIPSDCNNELSPWITVPSNAVSIVKKVYGKNAYAVYEGINSGGANSVYWVEILDVKSEKTSTLSHPDRINGPIPVKELLIENVTKGMKKKVKKVKASIEDFFVYPLLKSKNVRKWKIDGYMYTLQMQNPAKRIGYDEEWVKVNFPKTYGYLKEFEHVLLTRAAYKKFMKKRKAPFYSMYNVGEYTYAPYKVVWNRMGGKITACVISTVHDEYLGKKSVLPDNVLAFIPTHDEDEAYYICSIMNSSITDMILRSIAGGTKSFGTPKIVEDTIKIIEYDKNNANHRKLCKLAKKAHKAPFRNTSKIEEEIDSIVAALYNLSEEELDTVKKIIHPGR